MDKLVVTIHPDGSVETLLKDKLFDTRVFGAERKIERLSEVVPNEDGHLFFVKWLKGPMAGTCVGPFESYEDGVDYEVATVNMQRQQGYSFAEAT